MTIKSLKYLLAVLALTGALVISAKADLHYLGAVDFNNGPNNPSDNHAALVDFLGSDPGSFNMDHDYSSAGPVDVFPGEYFVVHYGKGPGGTGHGGSWEFFQVINGETSVTFPALGNGPDNSPDVYGHGGFSSARGFGGEQQTPDSGTTAALLGLGLTGLAGLRAKFGRH